MTMRRLRRLIPSLGVLTSFEAAARLGSFTAAAAELGVTQAAVSRRIKEIETSLGCQLFVRANRRVHLSQPGQDLFDAVSDSFQRIADVAGDIKLSGEAESVTIGVSLAFAHFRLLPALTAFHEKFPDIQVRVVSQDVWSESAAYGLDLELRYGVGPFPNRTIMVSVPDVVFPVCAPQFAKKWGIDPSDDITSETLASLPLIEGEQNATRFLTWSQWFKGMGHGPPTVQPRLQFSNYSDAAYAAMNGDGVAVGWGSLLQRPLSDGRLLRIGSVRVTPPGQHHLLAKNDTHHKPAVGAFSNWLAAAMVELV